MDRERLFSLINLLNLPKGEWVVFGGACLTARGLRNTTDLELFVTDRLYREFKNRGWEEKITGSTESRYVTKTHRGVPVLAFVTCGSEQWRPNVKEYLKNPEVIDNTPFMPLREMYAWKAATARSKDIEDLVLIDAYLGK
jgi:hypothetical protein